MLAPEELAALRRTYWRGQRVTFISFGEPERRELTPGLTGTVHHVDDMGTVHVGWDNGMRLGMIVAPPRGERADLIEPSTSP